MTVDALVAEIGSTTTVVSAFDGLDSKAPLFLGQGSGPTTVESGDVGLGLKTALEDLKNNLEAKRPCWEKGSAFHLEWKNFLACSSAAGGLRMTVHGLVMDMTVRAAREAALGAGAVIKQVTAGRMRGNGYTPS